MRATGERDTAAEGGGVVPFGRAREYVQLLVLAVAVALLLRTFVVEACYVPSHSMENTLLAGDFILVSKIVYGATTPRSIPFTQIALPYLQLPWLIQPERGDIIAFTLPWRSSGSNRAASYVKRCIGIPGDTVSIQHGVLFVNQVRLSFPGVQDRGSEREIFAPVIVPRKDESITLDSSNIGKWQNLIEREGHTVQVDDGRILIDGIEQPTYQVMHDYYFMMGDNRDDSVDSRYWGFVRDDLILGKAFIVYWSWDTDSDQGPFSKNIRWSRVGNVLR